MAKKVGAKHVIPIIIGLILLTFALYTPAYAWLESQFLVTVVIDNTPPIIVSTVPVAGETYSELTAVSIRVQDLESGIRAVAFAAYNPAGTQLMAGALSLQSGTMYDGTWGGNIATINTPGNNYRVWFRASNKMYLDTEFNVNFNIYTALQGDWYVAGAKITSTTQTVYAPSTTVPFKFVKTAGIADSYIACEVWKGTTKLVTLTNTATNTWEGSYAFALGTHDLTLKAYDGTTLITFSIVNLGFGAEPIEPSTYYRITLGLFGCVFIILPLYDLYAEKLKGRKWK